jgi:nucleoside-diphosphate-sugar epimerase
MEKMQNIVITGSTGVLGRRAVRELRAAGHRVVGVTRSARGRHLLERLGAEAVEADVFDEAALSRAFAGADTVVNLLTHVPPGDQMATPGAWDENDRLRREASAVIARAAGAAGARRLVQESISYLYAEGGDAWLDEDAPVAPASRTATALAAESNASQLFAGDTVILRFGHFLAPDSALTQADVENARSGYSPMLGRREAYRPTVWLDDAGTAVAAALAAPPGTYNVADQNPPTIAEIDSALAAVVGLDGLRPGLAVEEIPADLEFLARSQRVSTRRLREATGWRPLVRGGTEGWRLVTAEAQVA